MKFMVALRASVAMSRFAGFALFFSGIALAADVQSLSPRPPEAITEIRTPSTNSGKLTAGDVVELVVRALPDAHESQPQMAEQLSKGPVPWGDGRILWWRTDDSQAGTILVGLTSYKPGTFSIAPIPFVRPGSETPIFSSQTKSVEYASIGGDKSKDDIYPPISSGVPRWVWVVVGLLVLSAVVALLWFFSRVRQRRAKEFAVAPKLLSPFEEFEKIRSQTDQKKLIEAEKYKPHYYALSEAAKKMIGKSFRFDAEDKTTRELMMQLEESGMSSSLREQWRTVFEEMDVVKFTNQRPERAVAESLSERLSKLAGQTYHSSPVYRALSSQISGGAK